MDHWSWEQQVRRFFNEASKEYADSYYGITPQAHYYAMRQKIVLSFLERLDGGRILDVGCGPGMMVAPCTQRRFLYTGLDLSEKMIDECLHRHRDTATANFCVGRIQCLPFDNNLFDVLLCMGALEYVPAEEEDAAMAEMIRVLKPGGLLIISHLNRVSPYWVWEKYVYGKTRGLRRLAKRLLRGTDHLRAEPDTPPREFTERERHDLIKARQLKIIDTVYFGFNVFLRPLDRLLPRLAVWVGEKLSSQSRSTLRMLGMAFIIVAQKTGHMGSDVIDLVSSACEALHESSGEANKFPKKSVA
jgi:ubiquinone/menaquinone biosynthesis C-methylase UbiE